MLAFVYIVLKGKTNLDFTEARDSEWQWHQLGHMQVRSRQITTPAAHQFYTPDTLPATKPTGFSCLLESLGIVFVKFPGPRKSWKMSLVLGSPGNQSARSWNLLGNDVDGGCSDVDTDANLTYTCLHTSIPYCVRIHLGIAAIVYSTLGQA